MSKAINIIENGLRVSLDEESKDELTQNLIALYSYMVRRLLQANLRNDVSAVEEVEALMRNIADAWKESLLSPSLIRTQSDEPCTAFIFRLATTRRKSQLMLRLATEEQWDELIASEMAYVNAVQEIAHLTEEVDPSTMQEQLRPMLRLIRQRKQGKAVITDSDG